MTQVFLRLTAPASRTPEILQALEAIRLPAELDRDCIRTQLGTDVQDPDVVVYLEEWLSADGLERRVASPNFRDCSACSRWRPSRRRSSSGTSRGFAGSSTSPACVTTTIPSDPAADPRRLPA